MKRATVLLVAIGALGAPAAASATPRLGDWEGSGPDGAAGSFALSTVTTRSHGRASRKLAVENLVVQAPINCTNAFGTPLPVDVEVVGGAIPLGSRDTFSKGRIRRGRTGTAITASYRGGKFRVTYRRLANTPNPYQGGTQTCDTGALHLTFKPGHRTALKDGLWEGQTAQQEPVELSVVAGGRALESPTGPGPGGVQDYAFQVAGNSSTDPCAYEVSSPLFIRPNSSFSNSAIQLGDDAEISGKFTGGRSASGEFSYEAQSCISESWSASWNFR
jgi:hypothetical protein